MSKTKAAPKIVATLQTPDDWFKAVVEGDIRTVLQMLENGFEIDTVVKSDLVVDHPMNMYVGYTALAIVARCNQAAMVTLLLDSGADSSLIKDVIAGPDSSYITGIDIELRGGDVCINICESDHLALLGHTDTSINAQITIGDC